MTTYEKLKEALTDLDLTDAKHYAAELERERQQTRARLQTIWDENAPTGMQPTMSEEELLTAIEQELYMLRVTKRNAGWNPIETAPKHEYILLCLGNSDWSIGCWNRNVSVDGGKYGAWVNDDGTEETQFQIAPTWWMPLPTLPPKFDNVSCSQCGRDFGPGDHGFSHCGNHSEPNFSQAAYLVVAPSPIPGVLPMIEDMKMTQRKADKRADLLERAYSKEAYPCGLIVVPCKVLFDIPNASDDRQLPGHPTPESTKDLNG